MKSNLNNKNFHKLKNNLFFFFFCHSRIKCLTKCRRNLGLWLTPCDILRLKQKLKLTSKKFTDYYVQIKHRQDGRTMPKLKMHGNNPYNYPFVSHKKAA